MRAIERSSIFKRDYKREAKGHHRNTAEEDLSQALASLIRDDRLEPRYRDHELSGDWIGYRECHVRPDLLLIYRKTGDGLLRLARLGSYSELFG